MYVILLTIQMLGNCVSVVKNATAVIIEDFLSAMSTVNCWHVLANSVMTSGCSSDMFQYLDMGCKMEQYGYGSLRVSRSRTNYQIIY